MNTDERKGYAKGYAARERRARREQKERAYEERRRDFWQQAMLAVLPEAFRAEGWIASNGERISNRSQRVELAASFADDALRQAIAREQI